MALITKFQLETGIDAEYWKVIDASYDYINKSCSFRIGGWINKDMRKQGKRYITEKSYFIYMKPPKSDIRDDIYSWLKTPRVYKDEFGNDIMKAEFSDTVDDPEIIEDVPST